MKITIEELKADAQRKYNKDGWFSDEERSFFELERLRLIQLALIARLEEARPDQCGGCNFFRWHGDEGFCSNAGKYVELTGDLELPSTKPSWCPLDAPLEVPE